MTTTDLAAALLRDVPRIWAYSYDVNEAASGAEPEEWKTYQTWDTTDPYPILGKEYVAVSEVLAALTAALDGVDERAGEVLEGVTPGPWSLSPANVVCNQIDAEYHAICTDQFCYAPEAKANARFIAWCREGVPALIALATAQAAQIAEKERTYDDLYADALADAKSDAQDFDSDLWIEVRKFLTELHLDWRDYADDGITAEQAIEYIRECMDEETRRAEAAEAVAEKLQAECQKLGREVNMARYGQPDFAWSIHKQAMAELQARAESAEAEVEKLRGASIETYYARQVEWSRETFGPALRTKGIIDHITKELREIADNPHDLSEWIDVVILAMDGFWRHGGKPEDLMPALLAKQAKNMARTWPDWRGMSEDAAIEHDRSKDAALSATTEEGHDPQA